MEKDKILSFIYLDEVDKMGKNLEFEKVFEKYINEHPEDEEMWFRFIVFEFQDRMGDYPKCIDYLKRMIGYNNENILAKIFLAFIENWYWFGLTEETLEMLRGICRSNCNSEFKSMAYYIKAWYYDDDKVKFEKYLLKSIEAYSNHVYNYVDLANFYIEYNKGRRGRLKKVQKLLSKAIENIKIIKDKSHYFSEDNKINCLFLNRITGVYQFENRVKEFEEKLKALE